MWLLWSQQTGTGLNANKAIVSSQLTSDGVAFAGGTAYPLAYYDSVNAANIATEYGGNPELENPSFAIDPSPSGSNGFDLLGSYGTYSDPNNGYHTVEMNCQSITTRCNDSSPILLDPYLVGPGNPQNLQDTGGTSMLEGGISAEQYLVFAAANPGNWYPRGTTFSTTNSAGDTQIGAPQLNPNQTLLPNYELINPQTGWQFIMQADGNLVVYDNSHSARWSSGTSGHLNQGAYLIMQADGNLVIYIGNTAIWSSGTYGNPGAFLRFQDVDSNVVIYSGDGATALWNTGT